MLLLRWLAPYQIRVTHLWQKYIVVGMAAFAILLTAGITFGWPSLLLVYKHEGVMHHVCANATPTETEALYGVCYEQEVLLNWIYLSGVVAMFIITPCAGALLDYAGPRLVLFIFSLTFGLGCVMFGISTPCMFRYLARLTSIALYTYFPGSIFITVGGSGMFLAFLRLAALIPEYISAVTAVHNVCFDSSTIVYFMFNLLHFQFDIPSTTMWLWFLIVPISIFIFSVFWPLGVGKNSGLEYLVDDLPQQAPQKAAPMRTFKEQFLSKEYMLLIAYNILVTFWLVGYFGLAQSIIESIVSVDRGKSPPNITSSNSKVDDYVMYLNLVVSLGFIASPLLGFLLNRFGIVISMAIIQALGVLWTAMLLVYSPVTQLISFFTFSIMRGFYFATAYAYLLRVFDETSLGKLYGLMGLLTCPFMLSQNWMLSQVLTVLGGNFTVVLYVQLACYLVVCLFPLLFYFVLRSRPLPVMETPLEDIPKGEGEEDEANGDSIVVTFPDEPVHLDLDE